MTSFTPYSALIGGILIGLSATLLLWTTGRIAGISGIVGGLLRPAAAELPWRVAFIIGLIAAPLLYRVGRRHDAADRGDAVACRSPSSAGCWSATARDSAAAAPAATASAASPACRRARSAATAIFLAVALVTVFVTRHVLGGVP